jgi:hypothetical protein
LYDHLEDQKQQNLGDSYSTWTKFFLKFDEAWGI